MGLRQVISPRVTAVTLDEVRAHCRVHERDDDADLERYLRTAIATVERDTGRQLVDAKYRYTMENWQTKLRLPRAPLAAVDAISYLNSSGVRTTLASSAYTVQTDAEPGVVVPAYNTSWPNLRIYADSVRVEYWSGCAAWVMDIDANELTVYGRPFADDDEVTLWSPGDYPAGVDAGAQYYVVDAARTGSLTTFSLATEEGGTAIDITSELGATLWITPHAELFQIGRQAVLLLTGHLYEAREATTPEAIREIPLGAARLIEQLQFGAELYNWEQ